MYKWSGEKKHCTGLVNQIADCEIDGGLAKIDPVNMSTYFDPCISQLTGFIDSVKPTPIFMGATAGMRLLNLTQPDLVDKLFDSFAKYINEDLNKRKELNRKFDLKLSSIITGSEEGLFSWVTANHLLDNLLPKGGSETTKTCAMLDMGGASAQIAYEISNNSIESTNPVSSVRLYGIDHKVKSSSNLCFGVDQARLRLYSMLRLTKGPKNVYVNPCAPTGSSVNVSRSELDGNKCIETISPSEFSEDFYTFEGGSNPSECNELVEKLVNPDLCKRTYFWCPTIESSNAIDNVSIVALSSYFYSSNILKLDDSGSIIKDRFINESNHYCSLTLNEAVKFNDRVQAKYADKYCFQLKYIQNTLLNVYKLGSDWTNVVFKEKIGSASLGWSLGLMINATNAIPSESIREPIIGNVSFSLVTINCIGILCLAGFFFYRMRKRSRHEPLGA